MNKLQTISLAAAMLLTACAKQEITDRLPADGKIRFSLATPAPNNNTRAAEITDITLKNAAKDKGNGIKLYAYHTQNAGAWGKWYNDELLHTNEAWDITTNRFAISTTSRYIAYYPQDGNLEEVEGSFEGATFVGTFPDLDETFPQFTYTVPNDVTKQADLMGGVTNVEAGKDQVDIKLRHLLSQINFAVRGGANREITINTITLTDILSQSTFIFSDRNDYPLGFWDADYTTASTATYTYPIAGATETGNTGGNTIPANVLSTNIYVLGDGGNAAVGTTAYYWNATKGGGAGWDTGFTPLNAPTPKPTGLNNSLMLLPQNFKEGIPDGADGTYPANTKAKLNITYTIDGVPQTTQSISLGNTALSVTGWHQNLRYVYLLSLTPAGSTFDLSPTMVPWIDGDDTTVTLTPEP